MIIKTFSKLEIQKLKSLLHEQYSEDIVNQILNNSLIISIYGSDESKAQIENQGWKHLIYFKFDDIDIETKDYKLFNKDQARIIIDYIKESNPTHIFVNCEAGISRSVGVKVALEKIYNNKDVYNNYPLHNKYVSTTLLNVWRETNG